MRALSLRTTQGTGKRNTWGLFCCVFFLTLGSAFASSWVSMSIDDLLAHADIVVRGRVLEKHARWLERTGPSRIVTFYELELEEVLQGELEAIEKKQKRIRVGVLGGEVGTFGQYVHGAPQLSEGDEVVAFLGPGTGPNGARGILGFNQGILRLAPANSSDGDNGRLRPFDASFEDEAHAPMGVRDVELSLMDLRRKCNLRGTP